MAKRIFSFLLVLALLLQGEVCLGGQLPGLSTERINELQELAGENGAQWIEGTPPSSDMNAFQMWQWTDWFLSNWVRSLLGTIQDYEQLEPDVPLYDQAEEDQWQLRETENILSRFEAQLEEDRLAILNGISLYQSDETSDTERLTVCKRILEAESEIRQIIRTICADYDTYLTAVDNCYRGLQANYDGYTLDVHDDKYSSLVQSAETLEMSENAATEDFSVSVISTHQFRIRVCAPDQRPIENATVTVTNQLNETQKQTATDAQGDAVFWVGDLGADENGELLLNLHIEAAGYRTREMQTVRLRSGETRSIDLQNDDGTPYLIMGCFNGKDILTESNSYYYSQENTANHTFSVKLHCDMDGELELRYSVDANAIEYETVVKAFSASDSDNTVLEFEDQWLSKLLPGAKVSFTIKAGGEQYTTDTLLIIQKSMVEKPILNMRELFSFFSGSDGPAFTIPDNIPFINESSLSIDIPDILPRAVYLPSYTTMFAQGYDFKPEQANWQTRDADDEARVIKEFEVKGKADEALAMAGAYRNISNTTQSKLLGNNEAYVTPFASLLGLYRTGDHTLELGGTAGATMAFNADITQTFRTGPVPFLASTNFNMGTGFGVDVTSTMELDVIGGVPTAVEDPEIGYENGKSVSFKMDMNTSLGMGVKDDANVSFHGYGCLNPILDFTTSNVTADANADMGFGVTLRTLFLKWNKTLWDGNLDLSQNSVMAPTTEEYKHFDSTGADVPRPADTNDISYGSSGVEPTETKQLFSQFDSATGEIRYVEIGGQTYLFWIQPGTASGTNKVGARLWWYNLDDMSRNGEVSWLSVSNSTGATTKRSGYADYDFAVEVSRGLDNQEYCALTILSGIFSGTGSGTSAEAPTQSIITTVLMRQNSEKALEIVYYNEDTEVLQQDNYAIMPEVCLSVNGGDVSIVSSYAAAGNPEKINSLVYHDISSGATPLRLTYADEAEIVRYCIATPTASGQQTVLYTLNAEGELSRLTTGRDVLAQGDIISFRVMTGAESGTSEDKLFYLEQVRTEEGGTIQRLKSVTPDGNQKIDYDIETGSTLFDIVDFDGGVYLYWTECSTPDASSGIEEEYLVRCVRYDSDTDTAYGPFSFVELNESPCSIKLQSSGTGFYTVDLQNAVGSYQRLSLSRFNFGMISSAEMTAAVLSDPCVSAGDYTELVFSVKNTGNVPLSAFDVEIIDTETDAPVQTLHIDLDNPELSTNNYYFHGADYTITGTNAFRQIGSMYDPLNHDDWEITAATATGSTVQSVRTDLMMPGDTHSYQTKIQIPADWKGRKTLTARIVAVTGETALSSRQTGEELLLIGAPQTGSAPTERLGSEAVKGIDTDAHDLMLSAHLFQRSGEDYVHITIRNRSGNNNSDVTPILTASYRDNTLYSHTFCNPMGDDFGYSMDIPLQTLLNGQCLPELDLYVSNADYEDFADSDNHVHLLLSVQLCIVDQPVSITATEGEEALFSVVAVGGEKPYSYQWQCMTGINQWTDIPGADQDTYRIESVRSEQNGLTVRCVITDQFGDSVTSDSATLSVMQQPQAGSQLTMWPLLAILSAALLIIVASALPEIRFSRKRSI